MAASRTDRQPFRFRLVEQRCAVLGGERRADRLQIVAGIKAVRDSPIVFAQRLAVAQKGRAREHIDLRAGIVDVIFARDRRSPAKSSRLASASPNTAPRQWPTCIGPGRIGRDIFDIDLRAAPVRCRGRSRRRRQRRRAARRARRAGLSVRLMKPGPGDLGRGDQRRRRAAARRSASASSRGFLPACLASTIAALVARSPCAASRGGSTTTRAGRAPAGMPVGDQRVDGGRTRVEHSREDVHDRRREARRMLRVRRKSRARLAQIRCARQTSRACSVSAKRSVMPAMKSATRRARGRCRRRRPACAPLRRHVAGSAMKRSNRSRTTCSASVMTSHDARMAVHVGQEEAP